MHFDQRTQRALREVGISTETMRQASATVVEATENEAAALESFIGDGGTFYSDMDQAHSTADFPSHEIEYLDLYTHAADLRGYLRFATWGVYVEDGRTLSAEVIELTLGPTVYDRVRFATSPDEL